MGRNCQRPAILGSAAAICAAALALATPIPAGAQYDGSIAANVVQSYFDSGTDDSADYDAGRGLVEDWVDAGEDWYGDRAKERLDDAVDNGDSATLEGIEHGLDDHWGELDFDQRLRAAEMRDRIRARRLWGDVEKGGGFLDDWPGQAEAASDRTPSGGPAAPTMQDLVRDAAGGFPADMSASEQQAWLDAADDRFQQQFGSDNTFFYTGLQREERVSFFVLHRAKMHDLFGQLVMLDQLVPGGGGPIPGSIGEAARNGTIPEFVEQQVTGSLQRDALAGAGPDGEAQAQAYERDLGDALPVSGQDPDSPAFQANRAKLNQALQELAQDAQEVDQREKAILAGMPADLSLWRDSDFVQYSEEEIAEQEARRTEARNQAAEAAAERDRIVDSNVFLGREVKVTAGDPIPLWQLLADPELDEATKDAAITAAIWQQIAATQDEFARMRDLRSAEAAAQTLLNPANAALILYTQSVLTMGLGYQDGATWLQSLQQIYRLHREDERLEEQETDVIFMAVGTGLVIVTGGTVLLASGAAAPILLLFVGAIDTSVAVAEWRVMVDRVNRAQAELAELQRTLDADSSADRTSLEAAQAKLDKAWTDLNWARFGLGASIFGGAVDTVEGAVVAVRLLDDVAEGAEGLTILGRGVPAEVLGARFDRQFDPATQAAAAALAEGLDDAASLARALETASGPEEYLVILHRAVDLGEKDLAAQAAARLTGTVVSLGSRFYRIGGWLGGGSYGQVFRVADPSTGAAVDDLVIKLFVNTTEGVEGAIRGQIDGYSLLLQLPGADKVATKTILDIAASNGPPRALIARLEGAPELQQQLGRTAKSVDDVPLGVEYQIIGRAPNPDEQRAGARLLVKLGRNDLIYDDAKLENLYFFRNADGELEAGILDTDLLTSAKAPDARVQGRIELYSLAPSAYSSRGPPLNILTRLADPELREAALADPDFYRLVGYERHGFIELVIEEADGTPRYVLKGKSADLETLAEEDPAINRFRGFLQGDADSPRLTSLPWLEEAGDEVAGVAGRSGSEAVQASGGLGRAGAVAGRTAATAGNAPEGSAAGAKAPGLRPVTGHQYKEPKASDGAGAAADQAAPSEPDDAAGETGVSEQTADLILHLFGKADQETVQRLREQGLVTGSAVVIPGEGTFVEVPGDRATLERIAAEARQDGVGAEVLENPERSAQAVAGPGDGSFAVDDPYFASSGSWGQGFPDQWALRHIGFGPEPPGESAWDAAGTNRVPVTVAVVDTGFDFLHLDVDRKSLWRNAAETLDGRDDDGNGYVDDLIGWDFVNDDNDPSDVAGHGTLVAGIIAARSGNGEGIAGIDPAVRLMPLKALDAMGRGRALRVAEAIVYATNHGARVINLSLGGGLPLSKVERLAIEYVERESVVVVMAAGSAGRALDQTDLAGVPSAITVAATDPEDRRLGFSNWGPAVDIAAPGLDVLSLRARGTDYLRAIGAPGYRLGSAFVGAGRRYYRASGTSFAAPFVSGVASLLLSKHPELTSRDVRRILQTTARDAEAPGRDLLTGHGVLDARAALGADPAFRLAAGIQSVRVVRKDGRPFLRVTGTATADRLAGAWLELGKGAAPSTWKRLSAVKGPVDEPAVLADVPAEALSGADLWVLRLTVAHENGRRREARKQLTIQ